MEISPDILQQLEVAQAEMVQNMENDGPPEPFESHASLAGNPVLGAAGSSMAKHILIDHYMTGSTIRLWAYADNAWRSRLITGTDEQGVAQVAYLASRVDVWWNNSDSINLVRCWKVF